MGALLVVSLIVGALASSGAAATVADETSRLVCAIGGGDCEAGRRRSRPRPGPARTRVASRPPARRSKGRTSPCCRSPAR